MTKLTYIQKQQGKIDNAIQEARTKAKIGASIAKIIAQKGICVSFYTPPLGEDLEIVIINAKKLMEKENTRLVSIKNRIDVPFIVPQEMDIEPAKKHFHQLIQKKRDQRRTPEVLNVA